MSKIKSLADQLKSKLEEQKDVSEEKNNGVVKENKSLVTPKKTRGAEANTKLIQSLQDFQMEGQEKILIRLDKKTLHLLKRLKLATNIDMTRVIVFALHHFLISNPGLNQHISQTLNNMTNELD